MCIKIFIFVFYIIGLYLIYEFLNWRIFGIIYDINIIYIKIIIRYLWFDWLFGYISCKIYIVKWSWMYVLFIICKLIK